jgi:Thrombospondin type 3 repeat
MKRIILSAIGAGLIAALGGPWLFPSAPLQAQGGPTCSVNTNPEVGSGAANANTVLILQSTVNGENPCASPEAVQSMALGYNVEIASESQWRAKANTEAPTYATYRALILGDSGPGGVNCHTDTTPITAAIDTRTTWGPIVTGNIVVIGSDPLIDAHSGDPGRVDGTRLATNGIKFAAGVSGHPGLYLSLNCYYHAAAEPTAVTVLDQFGPFTVVGHDSEGSDNVNIVATGHPVVTDPNILTNADLSGWVDSIHERFVSFPPTFTEVAEQEVGVESDGLAYILARGPDTDGDLVPDSTDNCPFEANPLQEDTDENGIGDACTQAHTFPANETNVQHTYTATVPGQTEPETFVLGFDQVGARNLVCDVNFRLVLIAEETLRLAKINALRADEIPPKPPVFPVEYRTDADVRRGYTIRYEVECLVDTDNDGDGDEQAIPGRDYESREDGGVNLAFTFHGDIPDQFDIAQERTLEQDLPANPTDGLPDPWDFEADTPLDQYDRLLSEIGPVHLAKSSCDCVGSGTTTDISWFIAVHTALADPDNNPATQTQLRVLTPLVRDIDVNPSPTVTEIEKRFWNPFRGDGSFPRGTPLLITARLRTSPTGPFISGPNTGLTATVKKDEPGLDTNVALEGFFIFGDQGVFIETLPSVYNYWWFTVRQDTHPPQPLPAGKYWVTIASKYTAPQPFSVTLR